MKAFWSPRHDNTFHKGFGPKPRASVIIMGVMLLMLMSLTMGCSLTEEIDTATTVKEVASAPSTATSRTTSTLPPTTTTLAPTTTSTLAPTTTTTLAEETTTTVGEQDAITLAQETTTTLPGTSGSDQSTSTTAPPTTAPTDTTTTTPPGPSSPVDSPIGTVLYEISDWDPGASDWAAAGQWKAENGMLVTDGTSDSFAVAPVDLTGYPDYVVECEIQILDPKAGTDVVLLARMVNGSGIWGGVAGAENQMVIGYGDTGSVTVPFVLDDQWHKYRLEVRDDQVRLFMGMAEVARATEERALEPGTVGIYCAGGQINVRSFRVTAL